MARAPRSRKPRSVFVICESGSDVKSLPAVLQKPGLERLAVEDATSATGSGVTGTLELISSAAIVCAVLQERNAPNVYLELGYALGLRRPVNLAELEARLCSVRGRGGTRKDDRKLMRPNLR
jgi:hypothetical protein